MFSVPEREIKNRLSTLAHLVDIVKFIYFEKATKFCEISTVDLSYVVKSTAEIFQNFVAFSEYLNFKAFLLSFFLLNFLVPKGQEISKKKILVYNSSKR